MMWKDVDIFVRKILQGSVLMMVMSVVELLTHFLFVF